MNLLDLFSRDTSLRKVANTYAGEYVGPCPWCGGEGRFHVWPDADPPHYWCRVCKRGGDAIQYLRDREGLTFRQACEHLGRPLPEAPYRPPTPNPPPLAPPPSTTWQARARGFIEHCERTLWTPAGAQARAISTNEASSTRRSGQRDSVTTWLTMGKPSVLGLTD